MRDGHINRRTQDKIRSSIDAEKITKRLGGHALGKIKMTANQVRAAAKHLRKVTPDLTAQTLATEAGDVPLLQIVKPKPVESAA